MLLLRMRCHTEHYKRRACGVACRCASTAAPRHMQVHVYAHLQLSRPPAAATRTCCCHAPSRMLLCLQSCMTQASVTNDALYRLRSNKITAPVNTEHQRSPHCAGRVIHHWRQRSISDGAWQQQVRVEASARVPAYCAASRCLRNDSLRHRRVVYNVQCGSACAITVIVL